MICALETVHPELWFETTPEVLVANRALEIFVPGDRLVTETSALLDAIAYERTDPAVRTFCCIDAGIIVDSLHNLLWMARDPRPSTDDWHRTQARYMLEHINEAPFKAPRASDGKLWPLPPDPAPLDTLPIARVYSDHAGVTRSRDCGPWTTELIIVPSNN